MVSRALGSFVVAASLMFVGVAPKPAAAQVPTQPVVEIVDLVVDSVDLVNGVVNVIVTLDILGDTVTELVSVDIIDLEVLQGEGECPILFLTLGPLHLDLLGLVVHLDNCDGGPVTVRIFAETGEGNLLGNLLCGLLGGLDLGDLLGLGDLLDLLDLTELADLEGAIQQVLQAVLDRFLQDADETVGGNGNGQVGGPPAHAPAHGRRAGAGPPDHAPAHGRRRQDAPGENGENGENGDRCDILYLEINEIKLDLLGLNVETSAICLDVYAVDGGGLLGNLLCAVVGLLDSPGDRLGQLLPLLGEIRDLLGELGLLEDL